ncbi:hypothetical protein [Novosphingobium sp. FSW06-99]|uniref:hypothetical protein n=1 Tax=Novosphingobium sp. FSW06-99 TaxID=1739113 RepID=UPI00076DC727|nr:hypothetical protein [Novosphingobium sp. FSW06-99]KUR80784.1 hypothetical protein AQZ49_01785 [Novosphingobium sp. FSW06-99]
MGARSFFARILRGRPPADAIAMDKSWRAGDLAECVAAGNWICAETGQPESGPEYGERRIVTAVRMGDRRRVDGIILICLKSHTGSFDSRCFRKIVPQADRTGAADADFLPWLNRQPVREDA